MRGKKSWIILIILVVACTTIRGIRLGIASTETTTISVDPPISSALVGETFCINITVFNVTNLYGWEAEISFNASLLDVVVEEVAGKENITVTEEAVGIGDGNNVFFVLANKPVVNGSETIYVDSVPQTRDTDYMIDYEGGVIFFWIPPPAGAPITADYQYEREIVVWPGEEPEEGPFLKDFFNTTHGKDTSWLYSIDNEAGTIALGSVVDQPFPETGANATGTEILATIKFYVENEGATLLHFELSKLYTVTAGAFDELDHTAVDGGFDIRAPPFLPPVALFEYYTLVGPDRIHGLAEVNGKTKFNASASYDPDAWLVSYDWDFGDGTTSKETDPIVEHNYTEAGTYTVKLTVTDYDNLTDTATKDIIVGHDIAVTAVDVPSKARVRATVPINVTVENQCASKENLNVTVSYDATLIGFNDTSVLSAQNSTILSFDWDTTELTTGVYTINATATVLPTPTRPFWNFYGRDDDPTDNSKNTTIRIVEHDVAVTSVTPYPTTVRVSELVNITVVVENLGAEPETFNVTVYANETTIATENVPALPAGNSRTLTFEWNTTYVDLGTYTISANATVLESTFNPQGIDDDLDDNTLVDGTVIVGEVTILKHKVVVGALTFHVITESNSTISNFNFIRADKKISFNVTGPNDTVGFCNVTIPKKLLDANATHPWLVLLDGTNITDTTSIDKNHTHTFIYFTYPLSTRKVEIIGSTVVAMVHDVAVTSVIASHVAVEPGVTVTIDVTAANEGNFTETFNVTAYYNLTEIETVTITDLAPGSFQMISFAWHTTGVAEDDYTIKAVASSVTDETNLANNELTDGIVTIARVKITEHPVVVGGVTFPVTIESNSTISDFQLIQANKEIRFNVTGRAGTVGYCNVTIPINLLGSPYTVQVDDLPITPTETTNGTHYFLYFTYNHSTHTVKMKGATVATPPVAIFTPSTTSAHVGDPITFDASASSDTDGWIASYTWDFGDGNVTIVSNVTTVITHTFATVGTYTVTLNVTDNDDLTDTDTQSITIGRISSTIHIALSPESITLGENTTISGFIDPAHSGVTVTIRYRLKGEETWSNVTTSTDENSQYSYVWTPESTGIYEIKASWEGDENTFADETEVRELTVQEAPPPLGPGPAIPLYLITAVVAAVIVITMIVVYFVRVRKPNLTTKSVKGLSIYTRKVNFISVIDILNMGIDLEGVN